MTEENDSTQDQTDAMQEISDIGQEVQPEQYTLSSSSSAPAAPVKKTKRTKVEVVDSTYEPFPKHEKPDAKFFAAQKRSAITTELEVVEFFYLYSTLETDDERIMLLRKAKSDQVLMLLFNLNYSPQIYDPIVPDEKGVAECRKSKIPWGLNPYTLRANSKRLRYLFNNSPEGKKLPEHKQAIALYQYMEALHPAEADILLQALTQKLDIPGLTPKIVKDAFGSSRFPYIK